MSIKPPSATSLSKPSKFTVANPTDPKSFIGPSFISDLEFNRPFDVLSACEREENRKTNEGESEWDQKNLTHNEMYSVPEILLLNVERLVSGTSYSEEQAIVSLIRHAFEDQCRSCRLKRWWEAIRIAVIHRDQQFVRPQHAATIYKYVSNYKMVLPDFGVGKKSRKFRMPKGLHARISGAAKSLGMSVSEYSKYLLMRALRECEGVQFGDEMATAVLEANRSLEERIRIIIAHFHALRIEPCERLRDAIREVDLYDYSQEGPEMGDFGRIN